MEERTHRYEKEWEIIGNLIGVNVEISSSAPNMANHQAV